MGDPMLFKEIMDTFENGMKDAEMRLKMRLAMENPSVHLNGTAQNEMCMVNQRIENKTKKDGAVPNQIARERKSLSYEIHLQRSYLHYARKELPYEEVQQIEGRYRELKNLYWKLYGCIP